MSDRYEGRPFLKLVDSYVLWTIDALDAESADMLSQLEPQLNKVYGTDSSWQEVVRTQLDLDESFSQAVLARWAAERAASPDPVVWSHRVADDLIS